MSKLVMAVVIAATVAAFVFPSVFERYRQGLAEETSREGIDAAPVVVEVAQPAEPLRVPSGSAQLTASHDGHFRTEARLNGRQMPVLVDTGATYVSISEENARRLGLRLGPSGFNVKASTANGETRAAVAILDRVQIGRLDVRNVEALVIKGDGLPVTLLGMSFLNKLKRFGVEGDRLDLVQ